MKIISWNVNGIRAVEKKGFVDWLLNSNADVVCIQETKANPSQLSQNLINPGAELQEKNCDEQNLFADSENCSSKNNKNIVYKSFFNSAKKAGYSGTAIYSKIQPDEVTNMGIEQFDDEGRVTAARFGTTVVISAYFPNSQEAGARLSYKLDFCDAILEFCNQFVKKGYNIVLCGDYNIAHKEIDLANPKNNEGNPGFLPEERAWMDKFTSSGYVDTFRHFCDEPKQYTWWSYRFQARQKDIGWRIDYHCVNESFLPNVKSSKILKDVMGSDHCPVELIIE